MTLLSISQSLAVNVGVAKPTEVLSSTLPDARKMVQFTQEAGEELSRRADWGALRKDYTIVGTGSNDDFELPVDFMRLVPGNAITVNGAPIRAGLSADEWNSLTHMAGTPRYARLISRYISFYPYPIDGLEITVVYQSKNWCGGGSAWSSDSDFGLVPEPLIGMGALWRWRRNLGQDYQDHLAEFETALSEYAKSDDGERQP